MVAAPATLFAAEPQSLRRLARRSAWKAIPAPHFDQLVRCGFALIRADGPNVTTLDHAKLIIELTRATWVVASHAAGA
jgi:hypothetical protein